MTIADAIANATAMTGRVVDDATMLRWLSELDGIIAYDVFGADAWEPYTAEDMSAELACAYPWDGFYVHYLEAMTYYTDGEFDRYENAKAMFEKKYWDFRHYLRRTHPELRPCCKGGVIVWP